MNELKQYIEEFCELNDEIISNNNVDCEEISEDLVKFLKTKNINSQLLRIEPENFREFETNLCVLEYKKPTMYAYHYAVVIYNYVIDLRNLVFFITLDDFKQEVNELNKNQKIKYIIE